MAAGLPNLFGGSGTVTASLASHCNTVSLLTSTNGGFTTADRMTDPSAVLAEQFCLARTYAISQGEDMAQGLSATRAQIAQTCEAYGAQLRPHVAALSLQPADAVMRDVSSFVLASGVAARDLASTAKVCLSVGYRTDDMDIAIGSALLLTTLGEKGYGELLGHHLSQGFGASTRSDLSLAWYEMGIDASGDGTTAVFAPGQPDRVDLLRKAAFGQPDRAEAIDPEAPQEASVTLPTLAISQ